MSQLLRVLPPLLAVWAWALLAVASSSSPWRLIVVALGLGAAALARRAFLASALVELGALGVVVASAPPGQVGFVFLGSLLAVAARAAGRALQHLDVG